MAGEAAPAKLELPTKPVQEIVLAGEEVPERYIHRDVDQPHHHIPLMDCPVIDMGRLNSFQNSMITRSEELARLSSALATWGCFQVIHHGVESSLIEEVRDVSKRFFALPTVEKLKYSRDDHVSEGYGNDAVYEDQVINWNDRLHLKIYPESQRNLKLWPQNPPTFREILNKYATETTTTLKTLLQAMAVSLNTDKNSFLGQLGDVEEDMVTFARFNFYPPCPKADSTLGFRPHSDGSAITFLLQDKEVEGLQVEKDGIWFRVPIVGDALLVIAGDQLEIMSNGLFKSVVHRVVTDIEKQRTSLAMLFAPSANAEIGPVAELVNENRPQMYTRLTDYSKVYFRRCPKGQRPIDAMKI